MAQLSANIITITNAGGTDTIAVTDLITSIKLISTTITLSSSYTLTYSGTPVLGTYFEIHYTCDISLGGNTVTIFGKTLSQEEANSNLFIIANWNGSSFDVAVLKDNGNSNYNSTNTVTLTTSGANIVLVPGIDPRILILDGSILSPATLNAGIDVSATGINNGDEFYVFYNTIIDLLNSNTVTIFGIRLNDTIAENGGGYVHAVYNGSSWIAKVIRDSDIAIGVDEVNDDVVTDTIVVDCSFETGEQGNNRIYIYTDFTLLSFSYSVIKTLGATDAGTITININGTPVTIASTTPVSPPGSWAIAANTAIDTTGTVTISAPSVVAGSYIDLVSAKTTAGGKIRASLKVKKNK